MPRSRTTRWVTATTSSPGSVRRCAPRTLASRRSASIWLCSSAPGSRRVHPEDVEVGAEALRRAPGPADGPLGLRLRGDQREQPFADLLRGSSSDQAVAAVAQLNPTAGRDPLGLDFLCDLAQRHLPQRTEILNLEEVVERLLDCLGLVDLPGLQPIDQLVRCDVDEHHIVSGGDQLVREGLPERGRRSSRRRRR